MLNDDGDVALAYNGELYNFRELARGSSSSSVIDSARRSDTEVVLRAFEEWGAGCVERFNGMFAFAIWDRHERASCFVARDRFGVKPLYYAQVGRPFALRLRDQGVPRTPALAPRLVAAGAARVLHFQNIFTDRTLFEGVTLLPPGTTLTVGSTAASLGRTSTGTLDFASPTSSRPTTSAPRSSTALLRAGRRRGSSSATSPSAAICRGGMDSASHRRGRGRVDLRG